MNGLLNGDVIISEALSNPGAHCFCGATFYPRPASPGSSQRVREDARGVQYNV